MMALNVTVSPIELPVSVPEARDWMRVTHVDDDAVIGDLIRAAADWIETECGRQFTQATYEWKMDKFEPVLYVPVPKLSSVTSIAYLDENGTSKTLSSALYRVDADAKPGRITPAYGEVWPATHPVTNAVTITFVAGQGKASVPRGVRLAMLMLVHHWYDNRMTIVDRQHVEIPVTIQSLMWHHHSGHYEPMT